MPAGSRLERAHSRSLVSCLALALIIILAAGCTRRGEEQNNHLIRVGQSMITADEFKKAIAAACEESYPGEPLPSGAALHELRMRVLNQLAEEMIIAERGRQLGLVVSMEELEQAVATIKADYPDNTFEETLLENAVSFEDWRRKLETRLLIQKVIDKELIDQVQISSEDVGDYLHTHYPDGMPQDHTDEEIGAIVRNLRRLKAELSYKGWLEKLQQAIAVDINRQRWEELLSATD